MKQNQYLLNVLLTAVLGAVMLVALLVNTFAPTLPLPRLDIPAMTLLSLIALLLEAFVVPGAERSYIWSFVLAGIAFALLPWAARMTAGMEVLKYALAGGAVFTLATWLFTSALERISSGRGGTWAIVVSAAILYLASQGFSGILQ